MEHNALKDMRHSGAHLLAAAVQKLYPDIKFAIGPAIESGFYYDFDFGNNKISEKDFSRIEAQMLLLKKEALPFTQVKMTIKEAKAYLQETKQPFTAILLEDIEKYGSTVKTEQNVENKKDENEIVTFYKNGSFMNLCRGGHVKSFGEIGMFKLTAIAGAYFRGSEKNPMLTRIYAACFPTQEELDAYLLQQQEAKKRDHRILGPELGIFMFSEAVGSGLPLLLPKGETIKYLLMQYMRQKEEAQGYKYVATPVITQEGLYQRSGHATFYQDDMYSFNDSEGQKYYIKPMNCPHHHMIFEKMVDSYKKLPLRLAEGGGLYRNELSGTLTGLIRVRGPLSQNDAHIYIRAEQLKAEFLNVLALFTQVYTQMGIKGYWFRLSLPDFKKDKFGGDQKKWEDASNGIREALIEFNAPFVEVEGEAAFYGPKLDVQIRNVTGKEDSIATSQVDILVPTRMNLHYPNESGEMETPIVIHRAILGSYERFMGFLIEQTAGHFPFWLAPVQIKIVTINDKVQDYVAKVVIDIQKIILMHPLKFNPIRVEVDDRNDSLGKKIRDAQLEKIPMIIVIGPKDMANQEVSIRTNNGQSTVKLDVLGAFIKDFA